MASRRGPPKGTVNNPKGINQYTLDGAGKAAVRVAIMPVAKMLDKSDDKSRVKYGGTPVVNAKYNAEYTGQMAADKKYLSGYVKSKLKR